MTIAGRAGNAFARFLQVEAAGGLVQLFGTLIAFGFANSDWAEGYEALWETEPGISLGSLELSLSVRDWINDGLMTIFFFVISLELKRAVVLGDLGQPRVIAPGLCIGWNGRARRSLFATYGRSGWVARLGNSHGH